MKSSMKKYAGMAMTLAAMAESIGQQPQGMPTNDKRRSDYENEVKANKLKSRPVPKGANEYHFFDPDYTCIARTQEKANEKYERFKINHQ